MGTHERDDLCLPMLMRFKASPDPGMAPPGQGDKVMHAAFRVGDTTVLASDGQCQGKAQFQGFALSLVMWMVPVIQLLQPINR